MSDDNVEYMTGEELHEKWRHGRHVLLPWDELILVVTEAWNQLAAELRVPKPPPPKTMGQVLFHKSYPDGDWSERDEAAKLRDALNAAFAATKGAG